MGSYTIGAAAPGTHDGSYRCRALVGGVESDPSDDAVPLKGGWLFYRSVLTNVILIYTVCFMRDVTRNKYLLETHILYVCIIFLLKT